MQKEITADEKSTMALDLWKPLSQEAFDHYIKHPYVLGPHATVAQRDDPKHNLFTMARYKFCAKMLIGKRHLLEIGCGDGFGFDLVRHEVKPESITCVDFDEQIIADNKKRFADCDDVEFRVVDASRGSLPGTYDGAWCIDVIEHVHPETEAVFLDNIVGCLDEQAIFIVGTPNITAQKYASERSKVGHINLKDAESLRRIMDERFHNVFLFSMNDEVVHTGFCPMAHYLFAMGVGLR